MKKILLTLLFASITMSAHAADPLDPNWSAMTPYATHDFIAEALFDTEMVIDSHQTHTIAQSCAAGSGTCETNPIIGKDASEARIRNYFISAALIHGAITYVLPQPLRPAWEVSSIVVEASVIRSNKSLGFAIKF